MPESAKQREELRLKNSTPNALKRTEFLPVVLIGEGIAVGAVSGVVVLLYLSLIHISITMLFEHLLTDCPGIFADVRTYWSPEAVERVTGEKLEGYAKDGIIHLINSGAAALEGTGAVLDKDGTPRIKPFYQMTDEEAKACLEATDWCPADLFYFRGGGFSSHFIGGTKGQMPVTMARINLVHGVGPVMQLAEGYTLSLIHIYSHRNSRGDGTKLGFEMLP